jgi:SNF2 family DNA or RNA helicase
MDIFQQYKILDGGETFGEKFFVFRTVYFEDENAAWSHRDNHFPKFVPKKFTHEKMKRLIASKAVQAKKEDCIDLPPLVYKTIEVELSPEQKRVYKEMKEEFVTFIRDGKDQPRAVLAELAMHKALRLQQIVSGFVRVEKTMTDPEKDIRLKENPRLEILQDLLTDIVPAEKVIVWCCFRENYKMITEMLEKEMWNYAMVVGGMSDTQAEIERFQTDPSCRVLIANQQAGGAGLNLQQASTAIYYSKSFSLEHDIQSLARCYRKGSDIHQKVTRIDMVAPDTIDILVNEALKRKQNVSDLILDWTNL